MAAACCCVAVVVAVTCDAAAVALLVELNNGSASAPCPPANKAKALTPARRETGWFREAPDKRKELLRPNIFHAPLSSRTDVSLKETPAPQFP
jgi:hypothetical protein